MYIATYIATYVEVCIHYTNIQYVQAAEHGTQLIKQ